jgi:hypothetical protein
MHPTFEPGRKRRSMAVSIVENRMQRQLSARCYVGRVRIVDEGDSILELNNLTGPKASIVAHAGKIKHPRPGSTP